MRIENVTLTEYLLVMAICIMLGIAIGTKRTEERYERKQVSSVGIGVGGQESAGQHRSD